MQVLQLSNSSFTAHPVHPLHPLRPGAPIPPHSYRFSYRSTRRHVRPTPLRATNGRVYILRFGKPPSVYVDRFLAFPCPSLCPSTGTESHAFARAHGTPRQTGACLAFVDRVLLAADSASTAFFGPIRHRPPLRRQCAITKFSRPSSLTNAVGLGHSMRRTEGAAGLIRIGGASPRTAAGVLAKNCGEHCSSQWCGLFDSCCPDSVPETMCSCSTMLLTVVFWELSSI